MPRKTPSVVRSPAARSAPARAAISGAIAAMRSSDWPRPAPNTGSHSGTIWAIGSASQVTRSFRFCRNSFAVAANPPESPGCPEFCRYYEIRAKFGLEVRVIGAKGEYTGWRATRSSGDFDLRTFEVRAYPAQPAEGLRPGMSV